MTHQAIAFAWDTCKKHAVLLMALSLTFLGIWAVLEIIVIAGQRFGILWWAAAHLAFFIVFAGVQVGFIKICLALHAGEAPTYLEAFHYLTSSFKFLMAQTLYLLITTLGLVFLIIPGLYLGIRYIFVSFCLVENSENLRQSFQDSAQLTNGNKMYLLAIVGTLLVFNLIGACLLGIGLFVTVPFSTLVMVSIYQQLKITGD